MLSHTYQTTTQCYDPEDHNNKLHHFKNLKSCMCVDCITNDKMKKNFTFNWSSSLFACSNLLLASFNHICNSATNWLHSRSLSSPCWASAFLTYREGGETKNKIKYKFLAIMQNMWLQWQVESIMFDTLCYSQTGLIQIKATQLQESKHVLAHK
jgi:hypothetical protein